MSIMFIVPCLRSPGAIDRLPAQVALNTCGDKGTITRLSQPESEGEQLGRIRRKSSSWLALGSRLITEVY